MTHNSHYIYPGQPMVIALHIMRRYPKFSDATKKGTRAPAALEDSNIPGSGGAVYAALDLIQALLSGQVSTQQLPAYAAAQWTQVVSGYNDAKLQAGLATIDDLLPTFINDFNAYKINNTSALLQAPAQL